MFKNAVGTEPRARLWIGSEYNERFVKWLGMIFHSMFEQDLRRRSQTKIFFFLQKFPFSFPQDLVCQIDRKTDRKLSSSEFCRQHHPSVQCSGQSYKGKLWLLTAVWPDGQIVFIEQQWKFAQQHASCAKSGSQLCPVPNKSWLSCQVF